MPIFRHGNTNKQGSPNNVVHKCTMPPPDDIVGRYIDSGICVATRRNFRRFLTVSEKNLRSRRYLKSTKAVQQEIARHLQYYYHMIHPFSDFRIYWEFGMMIILFLVLILIPIETVIMKVIMVSRLPKLMLDLICCVDIIISFATGYYEGQTKRIVLDRKRVASHYLKSYFFIDVLSSVPFDFIMSEMSVAEYENLRLVKMLTFLKLLRITTLFKYLNGFRDMYQFSNYKFKAIKLIILFVVALLWVSSIVYLIGYWNNMKWLNKGDGSLIRNLLLSCFKASYALLLIGHGLYRSDLTIDIFFSIVCLTLGFALKMVIYAQVMQLFNKNVSAGNKYQQKMRELREYIRYKQLSEGLKRRIYLYFQFRFEKNYCKESDILSTLSDNLRRDIIIYTCQSLLESVECFRNLPNSLIVKIVNFMKSEIYLPNDVIVRAGQAGDCMYFIVSGTTAVYTNGGREICHIADGGHFGEIALLMDNEKRIASVVAIECCELFSLSSKDFKHTISIYPDLESRMRKFAYARLEKTLGELDSEENMTRQPLVTYDV